MESSVGPLTLAGVIFTFFLLLVTIFMANITYRLLLRPPTNVPEPQDAPASVFERLRKIVGHDLPLLRRAAKRIKSTKIHMKTAN